MVQTNSSQQLAVYIRSLPDFSFFAKMERYYHIGATLTDVIFQPGVNYTGAVLPRGKKIKSVASACMISGVQALFGKQNIEVFFSWRGRKPRDLLNCVNFFALEDIETEDELQDWIRIPGNVDRLKLLPGFGDKTVDYLKILVGIPNVAVDRHMITMLERAGIQSEGYEERKSILLDAARLLNVNPSSLDHSIWRYISKETTTDDCLEY